MNNNEYDDEEEEKNGSFLSNFYNNNKVLVWIFLGIIIFIIVISLLTKGGKDVEPPIEYSIKIYPLEGDLYVTLGRSETLTAVVTNDPNAKIIWSVENEDIATVDNGNVKGLDYGKTTVTATYIDKNDEKYTDTKDVIVADGDPNVILTDVSFKEGDLFMPLNDTYKIALTLTPTRGYVENETFTSSDISVVTVDNTGLVTSVGEGSAVVSVDINNGAFRKELNVYVDGSYTKKEIIITPDNISFDGELRKVKLGSTEKLYYSVRPQNADTERLVWQSSDETVVSVDKGVITAHKEGRAVITVTALNGETDRIDIEVEKEIIDVTSITLTESVINLKVGESKTIVPKVNPDDASNKSLSFTSFDDYIAFVDANETGTKATITGITEGNTTIVIESTNNIKKSLKVIVKDPNSGQVNPTDNGNYPTTNPYPTNNGYPTSGTNVSGIVTFSPGGILKYNVATANANPSSGNKTVYAILENVTTMRYGISMGEGTCVLNRTFSINSGSSSVALTFTGNGLHEFCYQKYDVNGNVIPFEPGGRVINNVKYLYITIKNSTSTAAPQPTATSSLCRKTGSSAYCDTVNCASMNQTACDGSICCTWGKNTPTPTPRITTPTPTVKPTATPTPRVTIDCGKTVFSNNEAVSCKAINMLTGDRAVAWYVDGVRKSTASTLQLTANGDGNYHEIKVVTSKNAENTKKIMFSKPRVTATPLSASLSCEPTQIEVNASVVCTVKNLGASETVVGWRIDNGSWDSNKSTSRSVKGNEVGKHTISVKTSSNNILSADVNVTYSNSNTSCNSNETVETENWCCRVAGTQRSSSCAILYGKHTYNTEKELLEALENGKPTNNNYWACAEKNPLGDGYYFYKCRHK